MLWWREGGQNNDSGEDLKDPGPGSSRHLQRKLSLKQLMWFEHTAPHAVDAKPGEWDTGPVSRKGWHDWRQRNYYNHEDIWNLELPPPLRLL